VHLQWRVEKPMAVPASTSTIVLVVGGGVLLRETQTGPAFDMCPMSGPYPWVLLPAMVPS